MDNSNENTKQKSKKKLLIIVIIGLLIIVLAVGGVILYHTIFAEQKETNTNGVVGKVSAGWETGIEESQDSSPKTGVRIPGYGIAEMKAGDTSLHLSIGNPKENQCGFYATLKLQDGTVLYKSELLEPGYGLTEIPLSKSLTAGEYNAIVYYECVTLDDTHTPLNSAESAFTLIVK